MSGTLVLGGTGFLGAHVVAVAHARSLGEATFAEPQGPPVFAQGRDVAAAPRFTDPRDGARWVTRDLAPEGALVELLDELAPARVVCCAAASRADACERDPELARRLNVQLPAELGAWCAERGTRLVHVSTDLVFGASPPPRSSGFREGDPTAPVSVYGATKAEGEQALLAVAPAAVVARLPLLYGNSGGRGVGASDSLLEAVERDARPPLFVDEWRTPLEVTNAAAALVELAHGEASGLLHVGGPERVSRHQLAMAVLEAMGIDAAEAAGMIEEARQAEVDAGAPRPSDVSLDSARARAGLETELLGVRAGTRRAVR